MQGATQIFTDMMGQMASLYLWTHLLRDIIEQVEVPLTRDLQGLGCNGLPQRDVRRQMDRYLYRLFASSDLAVLRFYPGVCDSCRPGTVDHAHPLQTHTIS